MKKKYLEREKNIEENDVIFNNLLNLKCKIASDLKNCLN